MCIRDSLDGQLLAQGGGQVTAAVGHHSDGHRGHSFTAESGRTGARDGRCRRSDPATAGLVTPDPPDRRRRQTAPVPTLGSTTPALPVRSVASAVACYRERLGFRVVHQDAGCAIVARDAAEIHLWEAGDEGWTSRPDLRTNPVCSGAESFLAGTASCRIAVDGIDELFAELQASSVLHPTSSRVEASNHGTRELHALDVDGNLLSFFTRIAPRPSSSHAEEGEELRGAPARRTRVLVDA